MAATTHHLELLSWTVGDRLRKARRAAGISTGRMADLLVVTANTIGNYESDRTRLPAGKLRKWAEVTGVPAEWIETGADPGPDPATPVSPCNQRSYVGARELLLAA